MVKPYDETMKKFMEAHPHHFTSWLRGNTIFECAMPTELLSRDILVDALCKVISHGEAILIHVEFQKKIRPGVPLRLLEYSVLATRQHNMRVYSYVIYLVDEGGMIEEPPLIWRLPDGTEVLQFQYESIRIWEVDPAVFRHPGREGILPLLVLTKGNQRPEIVEEILQQLLVLQMYDLLPVTKMLASLAFKGDPDKLKWLDRRFIMLEDILYDTPAYQQILQQGREEGVEQGIEEGKIQGARQAILDIVEDRFPKLLPLAQHHIEPVADLGSLRRILVKVSSMAYEDAIEFFLNFAINNETGNP